ncbi:ATP-binding protein [Candidatus Woesearchaeota archaeon]|nr:ATP-binding protein [Candidatus Woesearchaeota archaeon]
MIRKLFVDRKREIQFLESRYKQPGFEFIVLSGRRRVGKSRLLEEFCKDKPNIFLMCENRKFQYNLDKFNLRIAEFFNISKPNFNSFTECFEFITKTYNSNKKLVVVIDEFSYLAKNPEIVAEMQGIVDEVLKDKNVMLVLSGSIISLMEKHLLSRSSPLYGRTSGTVSLKPLKFKHLFEWFKNKGFETVFKIYAVADGIPKYLEFFKGVNIDREIVNNFFNSSSFLFREAYQLLSEELREPETYIQILEAIALGNNKVVEIANYSYMNARDVSVYLTRLINLGFVKKSFPVIGKTRKRPIYEIKDNYVNFWFNFVSKYFSEIEADNAQVAISEFKKRFNTYLGKAFENLVLEIIKDSKIFTFTKIGKWWFKDKEIDIVALNEEKKQILFGECKWQGNVNAEKIVKELAEKSQFVQWFNNERKESFAVFAKSFKKRLKSFEGKPVYCFDLKDLEKLFKARKRKVLHV